MNTLVTPRPSALPGLAPPLRLLERRPARPVGVTARRAPRPALGWLERLAAWAERQPMHRRLGSWTGV